MHLQLCHLQQLAVPESHFNRTVKLASVYDASFINVTCAAASTFITFVASNYTYLSPRISWPASTHHMISLYTYTTTPPTVKTCQIPIRMRFIQSSNQLTMKF